MRKFISPLIILALLANTAGCSWLKSESTTAKAALLDCAKQDLGQTVAEASLSLLMTVAAIIYQGGTDWQKDLDLLGTKYGVEAVACAAHVSEQMFHQPPSGSASTSDRRNTPEDRARHYVTGGHWVIR